MVKHSHKILVSEEKATITCVISILALNTMKIISTLIWLVTHGFHITSKSVVCIWGSLLVKGLTCDQEAASLYPGRNDRRIFFSRVNFVF